MANPNWKKGISGNPGGRPRNSEIEELRKAMKTVQKKHDRTLLEEFVERAYKDNMVLVALMRKLLPDQKYIEGKIGGSVNITLERE